MYNITNIMKPIIAMNTPRYSILSLLLLLLLLMSSILIVVPEEEDPVGEDWLTLLLVGLFDELLESVGTGEEIFIFSAVGVGVGTEDCEEGKAGSWFTEGDASGAIAVAAACVGTDVGGEATSGCTLFFIPSILPLTVSAASAFSILLGLKIENSPSSTLL